jgi:hypothetical protein
VAEVWHEVAGKVTVHNVVVPEVRVTVPVAADGIPDNVRVTALPKVVDDGFALTVIVYAEDFVTVKLVLAVAPL